MLRVVIPPIVVFVALAAALFSLVLLGTPDQALLSQKTIDNVTSASTSAADSLGFEEPAADVPGSEDPKVAELKRLEQQVEAVLLRSIGYAMALGATLAIAWGFHARRLEAQVAGPKGQRRAFPWWCGLLALYAATFGGCYWFLAADPLVDPNPVPFDVRLGLVIVAGLAGYWLATALAASVKMRPSVPLAGLLTRSDKGA